MNVHDGGPPSLQIALEQESLISRQYLQGDLLTTPDQALEAAAALAEPWLHISLDTRTRSWVTQRIANTLRACLAEPKILLEQTQRRLRYEQVASAMQAWTRTVIYKAIATKATHLEAICLATSDALWLARAEVDGRPCPFPLELATIYDSMVLIGAFGTLHTVGTKPDSRVLKAAGQILGHAAMVADRSRPEDKTLPIELRDH